ncbi:hypothetical protein SAMN04487926_119103 [Paraburkholderia steynii]|uniref:Uncharacterized protein n=1 Tax=Paraburkholderia steynii TaxID=1245441 RepID=A0A7Z7FJL2_9BURK|nr:hypothetical protein [Paraburkholderia steynii]SDI57028.1 hypothetical protein SAMN04487926_119103 [Paraburkholderia steynii]
MLDKLLRDLLGGVRFPAGSEQFKLLVCGLKKPLDEIETPLFMLLCWALRDTTSISSIALQCLESIGIL